MLLIWKRFELPGLPSVRMHLAAQALAIGYQLPIYAESFKGTGHLKQIQDEAKKIVDNTFRNAGV